MRRADKNLGGIPRLSDESAGTIGRVLTECTTVANLEI